ncbi:hypothetical protein ACPB8Q_04855 [Methanocaldococcus indicus]|uniref:hypothetical protein n=1 Tax=Methanocaldococcus indicus TaxID=213231 RepID=UPI003C6CCE3E
MEKMIELLIVAIIILPIIIILLSSLSQILISTKSQPYIQQIEQKDAEISALKQQISQLQQQLQEYKQKYEKLRRENITKADIEEIKQYCNITQNQINLLNQKFDIVNNNFITAYNTYLFYFKISFILNIALTFYLLADLISAIIFDISINMIIINKLKSKITLINQKYMKIQIKTDEKMKKN